MICCNEYTDLGCINACEPLFLGEASEQGTYIILLEFNEVVTKYEKLLDIGDPLSFDVEMNENYKYTGKFITPSNVETCFKFTSKIYL